MSRISQNIIDRVRDSSDIVDVVSQYVDLKQKGPNFFGLCPFHDEKTPSFSVAPGKQIYYCFGCNAGGNVFSFLMDYQQIPFPDAVKLLADRYNIPITVEKDNEANDLFSSLYMLHEIALDLYQENLFSISGKESLAYLLDRGLSIDMIKQFKIGYAKNSWDQLTKRCKGNGFTKAQILQSGLFTETKNGIFDRFRSRIMFPIFHPSGKAIAFGGRIFDNDDNAKYLNSPETPLYKKSNVFYGLQATRDSIRKEGYVILVEGYMDFLKLYQNDIHPVLSVSGTAFTSKHAIAISRLTKKIILLYDGDKAGGNAVIRAGWILLKSGLIPSVVRPPNGLDPDDWISKNGKNSVMDSINNSIDFMDYHLDFNDGLSLSGANRQKYLENLAREIKVIDNGVIRNDIVKSLSQKLSVDERDFIRLVNTQRVNLPRNLGNDSKVKDDILFSSKIEKAQIELLKLLINDNSSIREYVIDRIELSLFKSPLLHKLAKILIDEDLNVESSSIIEYFQDKQERDSITKILFSKNQSGEIEEIVSDCLIILKSNPIKEKIYQLRAKIREKESNGENPMQELNAITELREKLNDLKN